MPEYKKIMSKLRLKRKQYLNIERYTPDASEGLSEEQVSERISEGKLNISINPKTKSISTIIINNSLTFFNFLNIILLLTLIYVGSSYKNMLFMGIVISNLAIAIFQELRAKFATDKLSLLSATTTTVLRDRKRHEIKSEDVVLDDIILYSPGRQVVTDSIIIEGGCEVNESFLTGESEAVFKEAGDILYTGSFISSGSCTAQADAVGPDNAAYDITTGAKKLKFRDSEIVTSLKRIIKILTVIIIPLGLLFFISQYTDPYNTVKETAESTVAALKGMIPEGLILLTSTVFAVIVFRLASKKVLVNELYSVEMLARSDIICLDKTGTLTEGSLQVEDITPLDDNKSKELHTILSSICISLDNNQTLSAIGKYLKDFPDFIEDTSSFIADLKIPFSSKKKWCGVYFRDKGAYILGAPEIVLTKQEDYILKKVNRLAKEYRVLCLSASAEFSDQDNLPEHRKAICLITLSDTIRPNAKETVLYLKNQGVSVKIISGDNPITVSHAARQAGIDGWDSMFDMSTLQNDDEIDEIAEKYVVFGRTTPVQKQMLIRALRNKKHTVAMTGDGVNDVLAMRESDCSIAVAKGTDAARTVADIVLLDSSFESVPNIIDEGRAAINNIQRTASLFLVKTIYSTLLTLVFLFLNRSYPFVPIQLTLIGMVSIGIPSFFIAFQPNKERIRGVFLHNVMLKATPTGLSIVIGILAVYSSSGLFGISSDEVSTISVLITGSIAIFGVLFISMPLDRLRLILVSALSGLFLIGILVFRNYFEITKLSLRSSAMLFVVSAFCVFVFLLLSRILQTLSERSGAQKTKRRTD